MNKVNVLENLKGRRGMTLVEIVFAMGVLLMMALLFAAAFPMATQSRSKTSNRSIAVSLAERELEAARDAGYTSLGSYNGMASRGLVDGSTGSPTSSPYSITNVTLDTNQSIASSLPSGTGTLDVTTQSTELLKVTATVSWTEPTGPQSVTISTLITFLN